MTSPTALNIFGPPGSGKSYRLIKLFIRALEISGPERVGMVTFTRSAADEVRARACSALNINPSAARRVMPWVGTIHSLCFRRLGLTQADLCTNKRLAEFAADRSLESPSDTRDSLWIDEPYRPESASKAAVDVMVKVQSAAKHRKIPFEEALAFVPREDVQRHGADMLENLYDDYEAWKHEYHLYDYEDILIAGKELDLPIKVLLADEVQDNSPLLWDVINKWGSTVNSFICAGDPWQALYQWAGGDPQFFLDHPGNWHPITESRRLSREAGEYAQDILELSELTNDPTALEQKLLGWKGTRRDEDPTEGSTVYLARTHALLDVYRARLENQGTPYVLRSGLAPLQTKAGTKYKNLMLLDQGNVITRKEAFDLVEGMYADKTKIPQQDVAAGDIWSALAAKGGHEDFWESMKQRIQYVEYFDAVHDQYGLKGILQRPQTVLGTIHSYKGQEADHVVLCASWATYPHRNLSTHEGRRSEGCVAYVAVSRHRLSLEIDRSVMLGSNYPWP